VGGGRGEGGGEFLLFLHKNIVKILKFFPSLDITSFSNFGYFSQISLISQNGRKNPCTNVGAEFPTFYIYKKPLNERQKGNFLEILGNF